MKQSENSYFIPERWVKSQVDIDEADHAAVRGKHFREEMSFADAFHKVKVFKDFLLKKISNFQQSSTQPIPVFWRMIYDLG